MAIHPNNPIGYLNRILRENEINELGEAHKKQFEIAHLIRRVAERYLPHIAIGLYEEFLTPLFRFSRHEFDRMRKIVESDEATKRQ